MAAISESSSQRFPCIVVPSTCVSLLCTLCPNGPPAAVATGPGHAPRPSPLPPHSFPQARFFLPARFFHSTFSGFSCVLCLSSGCTRMALHSPSQASAPTSGRPG
ncbi:hypothetical protein BB558_000222 [Smittium angustum]|uniref:Uncharacterized protein n=1 Tax=Smittium angustum TaxID=133377 RepID=A0A2U1JEL3_SMIAN|nr:hypothetical protein BB558_000222 [Smittium angustum]